MRTLIVVPIPIAMFDHNVHLDLNGDDGHHHTVKPYNRLSLPPTQRVIAFFSSWSSPVIALILVSNDLIDSEVITCCSLVMIYSLLKDHHVACFIDQLVLV